MAHGWQTFTTIAHKEFLHAARDKKKIWTMLLAQILNFVMMAWIDNTVRNVPTVIVDQSHTSESRDLVDRLRSTNTFAIRYTTSSIDQARGLIQSGDARVAIVIPPEYSQLRAAQGNAEILALVDGSDAMSSGQSVAAIEGVTARMDLDATEEVVPPVSARSITLFNPQARMSSFMLPGLLAVILGQAYTILALQSLLDERERGNLERLAMTPMNYTGLILGKLAPWATIGILNALAYMLVTRFGFDVPIRGSLLLLVGGIVFFVITNLALGLYVAANAKSSMDAATTVNYLALPVLWFTGYIFPLSSLPKIVLPISYALPQTHFIELMRGSCLRGATATDLLPHVLYLVLVPIILTFSAARRFSKTIMQ